MMPRTPRRQLFRLVSLALVCSLVTVGCSGPILRPQSPEASLDPRPASETRLVADYTHPYGMDMVKVEAVSLATGLAGTGEDPPPTPQRASLLSEMSRRKVDHPNQVLASPDTALVLVRGFLRPGIQEGDRFDVEVRVPSRSETTSLRGGWVLPARMTEMAVLGHQIRQGHLLAMAEGPVLVDPDADSEDEVALATRGRVLGGGVALKGRPMGLIVNHRHQSIRISQEIAQSINHRFHIYERGRKDGVARPKTDEYIELKVFPRYKDNVTRYMRVVRNIAVSERASDTQTRLIKLEHQLRDPLTASTAAMRLEAVGSEEAVEILGRSLKATDPEVRFYAAEALAYLDETAAVEALAEAARREPAFRVNALAALSAMDDVIAYDALRKLLDVTSAETRYGAFRSLWAMNAHDPLVRGEMIGDRISLHVLDVDGPPMIHVTRSFRPEIVLFGGDQPLKLPLVLDAGKHILVNGMSGGQITVTKFTPGAEPEKRDISNSAEELIRTIVHFGGSYPDVVQALQQAKRHGALECRVCVDALPESGRTYDRPEDEQAEPTSPDSTPLDVATPLPDLFSRS